MAKKSGMWTYWIERGTGEMRSHYFSSVPNNGSYRAEVMIAHAVDAIDIIEIPDAMLGNYKQTLDDMRAQSRRLMQEIAEGRNAGDGSATRVRVSGERQ